MTLFWIICAVLLVVALLFVVLPLWRKTGSDNTVLRDMANLEILRDQSAELDADLHNGLLTQDAYEQGKRELQARLLEEVHVTAGQPAKAMRNPAKTLAIILAFLLPLSSVLLYGYLGNTKAMLPHHEQAIADSSGVIRSESALRELESELKKRPENPEGWWMLARTYADQKRFTESAGAYHKLLELVPDEAQLWANYADIYAMAQGQSLQGEEVTKLIDKALSLDANNLTALALSGSAAIDRGDLVTAITQWQKLLNLLQPDSQDAQIFSRHLQHAREQLAAQPGGKKQLAKLSVAQAPQAAAANPEAAITGKASLSPALAGKVAPTDIVFIMARSGGAGNMPPLAVLRKQVKDLPLQFTLDDSMAMQPQLKLSGFNQVVVVARVSRSGTPMAQAGDLQGMTGTVKPGAKGLNIVIDSVVP